MLKTTKSVSLPSYSNHDKTSRSPTIPTDIEPSLEYALRLDRHTNFNKKTRLWTWAHTHAHVLTHTHTYVQTFLSEPAAVRTNFNYEKQKQKPYSKNKILMTQRRLHEFSTVTIDDQSITNRSSIVTVLNSRNIVTDQIFFRCRKARTWYGSF